MAAYITALLSTCGNNVGQLPYLWEKIYIIFFKTHPIPFGLKHIVTLNRIKQHTVTAISISREARNSCNKERVGVQFWKILQKSYD